MAGDATQVSGLEVACAPVITAPHKTRITSVQRSTSSQHCICIYQTSCICNPATINQNTPGADPRKTTLTVRICRLSGQTDQCSPYEVVLVQQHCCAVCQVQPVLLQLQVIIQSTQRHTVQRR